MSWASFCTRVAVCTLRIPGSTTAIIASTPRADARPMCSSPASMSRITLLDSLSSRCCMSALRTVPSGHMHPLPPNSTVPSTSNFTPPALTANRSGRSSTSGFNLNIKPAPLSFAPVRSRMRLRIWAIGVGMRSSETPSATARLPSGSASTAMTGCPDAANCLARAATNVVFPTPPLPAMANFICETDNTFVTRLGHGSNKQLGCSA